MFLDCLYSIFRAGGKKPAAMAEKGADGRLIESNEIDNEKFHRT
jgi:hypothetical protein